MWPQDHSKTFRRRTQKLPLAPSAQGAHNKHATSVRQANWFSVTISPVPKATQ